MSRVSVLVIIPARYGSTRFPGKALADLGGKTVVRRCYEQVTKAVSSEQVYVATDDQRIVDECTKHGIRYAMTSSECLTGTDRVAEVARTLSAEWYVNVQGDEPFLDPDGLRILLNRLDSAPSSTSVFNACAPITLEQDFRSVTVPKVVTFTSADSTDPDGIIVSRRWDFGCGNPSCTSADVAPVHTFQSPGAFTVTLTVTDSDGLVSTSSTVVQVAGP